MDLVLNVQDMHSDYRSCPLIRALSFVQGRLDFNHYHQFPLISCYNFPIEKVVFMIHLENEILSVGVELYGAELRSVRNKITNEEYMWSGDAYYWNRVSPVLFPTVGKVFGGEYSYDGSQYPLSQHGFLRDQTFELIEKTASKLVFSFTSTAETLAVYPFKHEVRIAYELEGQTLSVNWYVFNRDEKQMYYSIGAHPAFAMHDGQKYVFELEANDTVSLLSLERGHVSGSVEQKDLNRIAITVDDFKNDALVYSGLDAVTLINEDTDSRIRCSFPGFDYVGLWTTYKDERLAPFVCIEPWLGITDEIGGYADISEKLAIKSLAVDENHHHVYRLEFL